MIVYHHCGHNNKQNHIHINFQHIRQDEMWVDLLKMTKSVWAYGKILSKILIVKPSVYLIENVMLNFP